MEILTKKLERQRRFTEDILAGMTDLVRVIDKNCNIIFINEPMRKFLGDIKGTLCFRALGKDRKCKHCISDVTINSSKIQIKEEVIGNKTFSVISSPIRDENGEIYAAVEVFRDITERIEMQKTILDQNNKMKKDIDFAKYLQHKILPKNGLYCESINMSSRYIPCESLGGDVFDIIQIDDENVAVYMADVVGHGVTASMMAMFIKEAFANIGKEALNPKKALQFVHSMYNDLQLEDHYYVTIIYGVYNLKHRTLKLSNAGHNCMPLIFREDQIEEVFIPGTPISTVFTNNTFIEKTINIGKGERILFYTDGIIEAKNSNRQLYESKILDISYKLRKEDSMYIIDSIIEDVKDHASGNIKDDIAIFMVEPL